ncbi:MAG TPA: TolC family protein [Bryobacteraceae bacterium]|nr:TolC family protein [Bryobacteraceae bacterium]
MQSRTSTLSVFLLLAAAAIPAAAQVPSPAAEPLPQAVQVPLSGRTLQVGGAVVTNQTVNPAAPPSSAQTSIFQVQVQGSYDGSVPHGQPTGAPVSLTLFDAIERGLHYNLASVSNDNMLAYARSQLALARSYLLPTVVGRLLGDEQQTDLAALGFSSIKGFSGFPTVIGPFHFFDLRAGLSETMSLPALHTWRTAKETARAIDFNAKDSRDLVVLAVAATYLQVLSADARVTVSQAQVNSAQAIYQQAADMNHAGMNARIDVLRPQVELQIEQQRLRAVQSEAEKGKLALARLIGLPAGQQITLSDTVPFAPLETLTLEQALDRANHNRADLRAAEAQVRASEHAVSAARAERYPSVGLTADYGAIGTGPTSAHGTFTLTGEVRMPIFEGGRTAADVEQATAALNQRKAELADLHGRIDFEIRNAFIDLQTAADQVRVSRGNTDLANEALTEARDRFAAGVTDTIEVVQAEQSVAAANSDYITSVYSYNMAKVSLARAVGLADESVHEFFKGTGDATTKPSH